MSISETTKAATKIDIPKLRAIAALFTSNFDGEVLNAARLFVQEAARAGLRPEQLIANPVRPAGQDAFLDHVGPVLHTKMRAAWSLIRRAIMLKAAGTKLLTDAETHFIFAALANVARPNDDALGKLFAIALKLGIV